MRITKRAILITETENSVVTTVTEHIVETDQSPAPPSISAMQPQDGETAVRLMCNICTQEFDYAPSVACLCPSCGSRDASCA